MRVSLYVRHASSRKYEKVSDKAAFKGGNFAPDTIFVLRYKRAHAMRCLVCSGVAISNTEIGIVSCY